MFITGVLSGMDTIIFLSVAGTLLFLLLLTLIVMVLHMYQRKRLKQILEIEQLKVDYEQTILTAQVEIQEQTLRDISQELHDNISQQLGLVKLQLNQIQLRGNMEDIPVTKAIVTQTIEDLRNLSHSLHPDRIATFSLAENIRFELERIQKIGHYAIDASIAEDHFSLEKNNKLILFRIVQELLHNFLKHAEATALHIRIHYHPAVFCLEMKDNGRGMEKGKSEGLGLISIRNRINLLKGEIVVHDNPDYGFGITIRVPL